MTKDFVTPIELQSVDATAIAADTWTEFDAEGIEGNCFMMVVDNNSDVNVFISWDGVTTHATVKAGMYKPLDFQTNASPSGEVAKLRKWSKFYVQGFPSKLPGTIYLSGYFN